MTLEKRRALLVATTLAVLLFAMVIESYDGSASIEYTYDEMGNILRKYVT